MSGTHSIFAPSSMGRIVQCHGSVKMCEGVVQEETEDSREGDAVHWVGMDMLNSMKQHTPRITSLDFVDKVAPNGVLITQEMFEAAKIYYHKVMDVAGMGNIQDGLNVERTVHIPAIHELCYGTPDADVWLEQIRTLHVFDNKYGHRGHRAFEHYQTMAYSIGRLDEIYQGNALSLSPGTIRVIIHIIQPRCYDGLGVERVWELDATELRPYLNKMRYACNMAISENPQLTVGPECRDCPAMHKCDANLQTVAVAVDYSRTAMPRELSNAALSHELFVLKDAYELLKYRKEALETEGIMRDAVPGWQVEQSMSNKKWLVPNSQVFAMGDVLDVDLRNELTPCTPTQAEGRFKDKKVNPKVIEGFYGRSPGKKKLVPVDQKLAREIFSKERL